MNIEIGWTNPRKFHLKLMVIRVYVYDNPCICLCLIAQSVIVFLSNWPKDILQISNLFKLSVSHKQSCGNAANFSKKWKIKQ